MIRMSTHRMSLPVGTTEPILENHVFAFQSQIIDIEYNENL